MGHDRMRSWRISRSGQSGSGRANLKPATPGLLSGGGRPARSLTALPGPIKVEGMGWRERDWARFTPSEREQLYGGSSEPPRLVQARPQSVRPVRSAGSYWRQRISGRQGLAVVVVAVAPVLLLALHDAHIF